MHYFSFYFIFQEFIGKSYIEVEVLDLIYIISEVSHLRNNLIYFEFVTVLR
jgi:hypothetical protein